MRVRRGQFKAEGEQRRQAMLAVGPQRSQPLAQPQVPRAGASSTWGEHYRDISELPGHRVLLFRSLLCCAGVESNAFYPGLSTRLQGRCKEDRGCQYLLQIHASQNPASSPVLAQSWHNNTSLKSRFCCNSPSTKTRL